MAANNDNAMTRFLFAILKQKCLKDIDWNQVAHDPILAQEITNGHAARMRYSRFRSAMLGLEPQRRNRTNASKSKVTKSKKEPKTKKEGAVKQDPAGESSGPASLQGVPKVESPKMPSPKVKQEPLQQPCSEETQAPTIAAGATAGTPSTPAAPLPEASHAQMPGRLLTPCSETDLLAPCHSYATSPAASEMLHGDAPFDFSAPLHCTHEAAPWPHGSPYQAYGMAYELGSYPVGFCAHHDHTQSQMGEESCFANADVMDPGVGHVAVKHEGWGTQGYHGV